MTIDDQIRDKKNYNTILIKKLPKYVLSSKKFNKYEEILPSNQKQMIEQAKFTYFPLGKVLQKQIKTIEDQAEKQIEALKNLKDNKEKQIDNADDYNNKLLISKEREIFKNIYNERFNKLEEWRKTNNDDLKFTVNSTGNETKFSRAKDPITLLNKIKSSEITIEEAKKLQGFNNYPQKYEEEIKLKSKRKH